LKAFNDLFRYCVVIDKFMYYSIKYNKTRLTLYILNYYLSYVSKWSFPLSKTVTKRMSLVLTYLWRKRKYAVCGTALT